MNRARQWLGEARKFKRCITDRETPVLPVDFVFQEATGTKLPSFEGEVLKVFRAPFVLTPETGAALATLCWPQCHPVPHGDVCHIIGDSHHFSGVLVTAEKRETRLLFADIGALLPRADGRGPDLDQDLTRPQIRDRNLLDFHFPYTSQHSRLHGAHVYSFTNAKASSTEAS